MYLSDLNMKIDIKNPHNKNSNDLKNRNKSEISKIFSNQKNPKSLKEFNSKIVTKEN